MTTQILFFHWRQWQHGLGLCLADAVPNSDRVALLASLIRTRVAQIPERGKSR